MDAPQKKPWNGPKAKEGTTQQTGVGGQVKWGASARPPHKVGTIDDHAANGKQNAPGAPAAKRTGPPVQQAPAPAAPAPKAAGGGKAPVKKQGKPLPPWLQKKAGK